MTAQARGESGQTQGEGTIVFMLLAGNVLISREDENSSKKDIKLQRKDFPMLRMGFMGDCLGLFFPGL